MDIIERSLQKAFINQEIEGSQYDPKMIINKPEKQEFLLNTIQEEIDTCRDFFFSVAFITQDGLNAIKSYLADLAKKGIKGRLITSTYLSFNAPDVFESLLAIPNLEVKLSAKKGFHAKGYLFTQENYHSFIVGSSNLTMSALKVNYEWNIRLTSYDQGELISQIHAHLEKEWREARPLDRKWVADYRENYQPISRKELADSIAETTEDLKEVYIEPNSMQKAALASLAELRQTGAKKGLIVSATGTGKTFLSAFDVSQFQPQKMLFIVHREQILKKAMETFKRVIAAEDEEFGILSGNSKDLDAKYLFATIQTISKPAYRDLFDPEAFDYILIDEVHKAGADSYVKTLDYFNPQFLLGMTATPERTDGFNIFELFDYNVAYEIRLQEALEEDLLCPFHYFGVSDYEYNGETINETTNLQYLTTDERVEFLIDKINYYGCSHNQPKALVFCSRKEEAKILSAMFNQRGLLSTYLSGDDSILEREIQVERLENGELEYIFTVDIFNEGIDIPKVNQVIMLRNTQSSIIFIQQLGRGLRKDKSKDFVTIIDFIGNYKNNYMIPMALSGDISRNKNSLRKDTFETNYISGLSAVNFEEVAKERIFKAIDAAKMDSMKELREIYQNLKNRLNRVPYLYDFLENKQVDPLILANKKTSYYDFLVFMKDEEGSISPTENSLLAFFSRELLAGMRRHELFLLNILLTQQSFSISQLKIILRENQLEDSEKTIASVLRTLSIDFFTGGMKKTYKNSAFISFDETDIQTTDNFEKAKQNDYFVKLLADLLKTAFAKSLDYETAEPLTRYKKYRRRDALRLLNWHEQMVDQNVGGYTYKDGEFVIFVTLMKGEDFKGALMAYEDEFIDESTMRWFTKSPRKITSPEVKILQQATDWNVRVFVKKSDDEGTDFYYLGEVKPLQETIKELQKPISDGTKKSVVEMDLRFLEPIENRLFKYLN